MAIAKGNSSTGLLQASSQRSPHCLPQIRPMKRVNWMMARPTYVIPRVAALIVLASYPLVTGFTDLSVLAQAKQSIPSSTTPSSSAPNSVRPTSPQGLPIPPRRPPPNRTRPGGGLNPNSSALCTSPIHDSLVALIPRENPVLTTSASPTVFVYVPFTNAEVKQAEFSMLVWPREMQRHYHVEFTLSDRPGILPITLPDSPDYELAEGEYYRWYFHVYCQDGDGVQPDLTVDGMVQRVAPTPERDRLIQSASPEIWYDAIAHVADQLQTDPDNPTLQQQWQDLLRHIGIMDLENTNFFDTADLTNRRPKS